MYKRKMMNKWPNAVARMCCWGDYGAKCNEKWRWLVIKQRVTSAPHTTPRVCKSLTHCAVRERRSKTDSMSTCAQRFNLMIKQKKKSWKFILLFEGKFTHTLHITEKPHQSQFILFITKHQPLLFISLLANYEFSWLLAPLVVVFLHTHNIISKLYVGSSRKLLRSSCS